MLLTLYRRPRLLRVKLLYVLTAENRAERGSMGGMALDETYDDVIVQGLTKDYALVENTAYPPPPQSRYHQDPVDHRAQHVPVWPTTPGRQQEQGCWTLHGYGGGITL